MYITIVVLDDSDSGGKREGMSDTDDQPHRLATTHEKYLWGLLKGRDYGRSNVIIAEVEGRGRSAFAAWNFAAGDFVCEYASCIRSPND